MPPLDVAIESRLPGSLPAGRATALFLMGRASGAPGLRLVVDGELHAPSAARMPRPDLSSSPRDPAYRSGWWAIVAVPARPAGETLRIAARAGGDTVPLAEIGVIAEPPAGTPARLHGRDTVAVCMATHEPDPELFAQQIASLRAQSDEDWVCLISDDASGPEALAAMRRELGEDPRFALSRSEVRLGFYRNFERALTLVPREARLVALADQDDRWYPDKLAALRAALGDAQLAFSDQRLVARDGHVLRDSLWVGRRNRYDDVVSMLVAGGVTGAASLMRREVADLARPFPESPGIGFHDQWLALVALSLGRIAYVDRPLYDYVQHRGAVFGDVEAGARSAPWAQRWPRRWRAAYFGGYVDRALQAQTLLARLDGRIDPGKRRALQRYIAAERRPWAWLWLAARSLRRFAGRDETLGSEGELAAGVLWRWLAELRARIPLGTTDARAPDRGTFQQRRLRRWRAQL